MILLYHSGFLFSQLLNSVLYNWHSFCLGHYWLIRIHITSKSCRKMVLEPCIVKVRGSLILFPDLAYVMAYQWNLPSCHWLWVCSVKCFRWVFSWKFAALRRFSGFYENKIFIKIRLGRYLIPFSLMRTFSEQTPGVCTLTRLKRSISCWCRSFWWQLYETGSCNNWRHVCSLDERFS